MEGARRRSRVLLDEQVCKKNSRLKLAKSSNLDLITLSAAREHDANPKRVRRAKSEHPLSAGGLLIALFVLYDLKTASTPDGGMQDSNAISNCPAINQYCFTVFEMRAVIRN